MHSPVPKVTHPPDFGGHAHLDTSALARVEVKQTWMNSEQRKTARSDGNFDVTVTQTLLVGRSFLVNHLGLLAASALRRDLFR